MQLMSIMLGGALGAVLRYMLAGWINKRLVPLPIPLGTFIVNLLGSFALGWILGMTRFGTEHPMYLFWGIGFLGAFTTFSTFSLEAVTLFKQTKKYQAFAYILLTISGSITSFIAGFYLGN